MSTNYEEIARLVKSTYEGSLHLLKPSTASHWAIRSWRIKGETDFLNYVILNLKKQINNYLVQIKSLESGESEADLGQKILKEYKLNSERKRRRFDIYKQYPETLFYGEFIHLLFAIKSAGQIDSLPREFQKGIDILNNNNVPELFFKSGLIAEDPSVVANTMYYLRSLGVDMNESKLISGYKNMYAQLSENTNVFWKNRIYAMTHMIIADTYFYQQYADAGKHKWILDIFTNEINDILKNTNADIVAEVGLCFLLCNVEGDTVFKCKNYIADCFDFKKGYISQSDKDSLERGEHRNIIAYMLLEGFTRLYPGPHFANLLK